MEEEEEEAEEELTDTGESRVDDEADEAMAAA